MLSTSTDLGDADEELIVKKKEVATSFFPISIVQLPRVVHVLISIIVSSCDRSLLKPWHCAVWLKKIMLQVLLKHSQ